MGNSNWAIKPLKELCSSIGDGLHGTPKYVDDSEYYFVNGNNLKNGFIVTTENTKKVGLEEYQKYFLEFDDNTLFMSINGTLGNLAFYKSEKVILGKSAAYINCKSIDRKFLYYYLQLDYVQKKMWDEATGSTIKNLSLESLKNFPIPVPSPETQQKIAAVLSALDAKIELNARINAELESMAKTLYDYWFVQFKYPHPSSPKWDMEALQNSQNSPVPFGGGAEGGGGLVWNEALKREIPLGWEVKNLEDIENNIVTGKTPSTSNPEYYGGDIPFITIGDIRGNMHVVDTQIKLSKAGAEIQKNKFIPKGSLCVTCIASPGLIGFATKDSQTNQQINSIVIQNEENRTYLYFALNDYFKFAKGAKIGNTFANMNKGDFSSIKLVYPDKSLLLNFEEIVSPMVKEILTRQLESQTLTELRDWLLPMLMNGQVKV